MSRRRHQNGFVKATGKKPRTWTGYWYEYIPKEDGTEKRYRRSRVLGPVADLTKGQAKERLRELIGTPKARIDSTFASAAESYTALKEADWGRKNRKVMESVFEQHILPGLGSLLIRDIKPTDIKRWINKVGQQFSYSVTHKCLTHVRAIFDQLIEDDILTKNPARSKKNAVRMPKTKKPSEHFLQLDECKRLLEAAEHPRDHILLRILLTCALRPSEAFALRLQDVLPGKLRIDEAVVMGSVGETKTEESNGFVPISPALESELRKYIHDFGIIDPDAYLFPSTAGTPYDPKNYLNRKLKPLAAKAQVSAVNFQVFRRTCATHFQDYGGKVKDTQALLRHTNAAVTLKHYQKTLDGSLIAAVANWDDALTKQKVVPIRGPKKSA